MNADYTTNLAIDKVETDCVGNLYTRHCLITEAILSTIVDPVKVPSDFRWRTKGEHTVKRECSSYICLIICRSWTT